MGKGLAALLKDEQEVTSAHDEKAPEVVGNIAELDLESIEENPHQPRTLFNQEALEELAASVKELGIIQPITVRKEDGGRFQIISGERRFRAAKLAGLETIPAYVRLADDQSMLEMALVENIQREELDSIEIALSYERLIDECQLTQEAMSERVGKKRSTITNYLRLLKLQPLIQAGLRDKMISMGHARALVNVEEEETQLELYQKAIAREWSVRQTEEAVRKAKEGKKQKTSASSPPELPEKNQKMRDELAHGLEVPVDLKRSKRGKGKIVISFESDRELKRLYKHLRDQ
ncbi:MAG: ParB/RepB/Spo0J family partition protein [Schleiferiaceae bacterium]|nr:ParB/RepB/Spo0J family partition protein [Schleiferiaceae bacterium]